MEEREGGRERGKNGRDDIRIDMGGKITINLTCDHNKCVHCAQAGVNHKNVPAQQISKVTSNT